jgi:hypothetical protein
MKDFLQVDGYSPVFDMRLKSLTMDLQVITELCISISFGIRSGPALLLVLSL